MRCRAHGERGYAGVAGAELEPVVVRALERVAEQLCPPATRVQVWQRLEPAGIALVQIRALILRQPPVGGLANQDVAEAVAVAATRQACWAQQLFADQRLQVPGQQGA